MFGANSPLWQIRRVGLTRPIGTDTFEIPRIHCLSLQAAEVGNGVRNGVEILQAEQRC
jgi:hypothetical protein